MLSKAPGVHASFLLGLAAVGLSVTCCFLVLRQLARCLRMAVNAQTVVASCDLQISGAWHTLVQNKEPLDILKPFFPLAHRDHNF